MKGAKKRSMIYLDYAATSPVFPAVLDEMNTVARDFYANPSSLYTPGYEARKILHRSRAQIARTIGAEADEIVFTSGGTESNHLAIIGVLRANRNKTHLIVGATEHHSVLALAHSLEKDGYSLTVLPCDSSGCYDPDDLRKQIRPETALVSLQIANNETGVLQPIEAIGTITRALRIPLHCDAVAAYGHIPLDTRASKIDLLSASAHKMGGPRGAGFLFIRNEIPINPLFSGGSQERSLRPGTENLPAIAGFAKAVELASIPASASARDRLESRLLQLLPHSRVNGAGVPRLPHILSLTIPGVPSERLLPQLSNAGIYVSARAACASGEREPSHVLLAMGLSRADADATIRFSTGFDTKLSEIDNVSNAIDFVVRKQNYTESSHT